MRLKESLAQSRAKNPNYSLRAFAKKLNVSPAALSEFLSGRRRFSKKMAERIADRLLLSPLERDELLRGFSILPRTKMNTKAKGPCKPYIQINMDHYHVISDWYHFAILSLAETKGFQSDSKWIAERLGLRNYEVLSALERLERLGMLEKNSKGRLVATGVQYSTSDEIANIAIRKSHLQDLEIARSSLENDPVDQRDFTSVTMAIDPERLGEAKKMVREFRDQLCRYLEGGKKSEVFKMCFNMVPLTKMEKKI